MSLVPPGLCFLRKLYNDAQGHDIEYTSSAFWQAILQQYFKLEEDYISVAEYSPDESRSRTDITVLRYHSDHDTIEILKLVEAKRPGTAPKEAETDAYKKSCLALDKYEIDFIYAMTTWGTKFRLWRVSNRTRLLEAFDNGAHELNRKADYIDADSIEAGCLVELVWAIKSPPAASTLYDFTGSSSIYGGASAQLAPPPEGTMADAQMTGSEDPVRYSSGAGAYVQQQGQRTVSGGRESLLGQASGSGIHVEPAAQTSTPDEDVKIVEITHRKHNFSHDEFIFKRGKKFQSTEAADWEWVEAVQLWKCNKSTGTIYYTDFDFSSYK